MRLTFCDNQRSSRLKVNVFIFPWSAWYSLFTGLAITHLLYMRLTFCEYQRSSRLKVNALIFPWSTWYSLFTGLAITHLLYMRLKFCEYQRSSGLKVKITMNNKNNIYLQIPINDMQTISVCILVFLNFLFLFRHHGCCYSSK
jgi:hypothetical protein